MPDILETVRADDFVEYFLYLVDENSTARLQEIYNKIFSNFASLIENYIWHKDEFNLSKITDPSGNAPPHLHGLVHYGENIEDEWFVVYLLTKISLQFDDLFIRVSDSDGEFLLIEAANYLPKWINPENSADQIYLHKGSVRLSSNLLTNSKKSSTINETIIQLKNCKNITPTEQAITKCIGERIKKYDDGLHQLLHNARAYVPAKIAALLDAKPGLIASAVSAFCQRDVIDTRVLKKIDNFPPDDMVLRLVTFTKFLYAIISRQKIYPEKKSSWKLPPTSSPYYKEYLLGYKITCGFEILASRCSEKFKTDLKLSKKWNQYVEVLKRKGYFKDLLDGSNEYVDLEKKARIYFLDNVGIEEAENNAVMHFLQTVNCDVDKFKREESQLPPSDDEKWMEISEEEFNKLLEERFGIQGVNVTDSPEMLSSTIHKFLNSASDIDGVEFKNDINFNAMDVDENQSNSVNFDPNDFMSSIDKMLDIMKLEQNKTVNSDMSDYEDSDDYESETEENDEQIKSYMDLMDKDLQATSLSQSFVKKSDTNKSETSRDADSVDIDMNALQNILKSYEEEFGGSGPAGNLIHSLGLKMDRSKSE